VMSRQPWYENGAQTNPLTSSFPAQRLIRFDDRLCLMLLLTRQSTIIL
jgi:hypothetical protein